jgi:hypothetical protein
MQSLPVAPEKEAWWAPEPTSKHWRKEKSLVPAGKQMTFSCMILYDSDNPTSYL